MNRIPPRICPWCRSEFPENGPVPAAPICHGCHAVLRSLPAEMLAEMLVYLVGYSQVALQVLLEASDSIKDLAGGALSRRNRPQHRQPARRIHDDVPGRRDAPRDPQRPRIDRGIAAISIGPAQRQRPVPRLGQ